jgi:hypothetical protein
VIVKTEYKVDCETLYKYLQKRDPLVTKYKPEFSSVTEFKVVGGADASLLNPLENIPESLQIFPKPIFFLYTFSFNNTLDWHEDGMLMDHLSQIKYVALLKGQGTLEVNIDDTIYSENLEPLIWYSFPQLYSHRWITTESEVAIAVTLPTIHRDQFSKIYFRGPLSDRPYRIPKLEHEILQKT